jgi:predicted transposase YbfD/YdcC
VLALKDNQGQLFEDVMLLFDGLEESGYRAFPHDYARTLDEGHGRVEERECWTISDPEVLRQLRGVERWSNLITVSRIRAQRVLGGERSCEDRYHIASITGAKRVLWAVRSHWGIENGLHWTLDIAFDEDRSRVRKDHAPENLALLRHLALNLLKQEHSCNRGIKGKRLMAAWKEDYLLKVLSGLLQMRN